MGGETRVTAGLSVFGGVLARELKGVLGSPGSAVMALVMGTTSLVVFRLVLSGSSQRNEELLRFLLPGFLALLALGTISAVHGRIQQDAANGLLAIVVVSSAPPSLVLAASVAAQVVHLIAQAVVTTLVAVLVCRFPLTLSIANGLKAMITMMTIGVGFSSLGLLIFLWVRIASLHQALLRVGLVVASLASTAFIPLERIPGALRWAVAFNPLSYTCSALRASLGGASPGTWAPSMLVLAGFSLVAFAATVLSAKRLETFTT